jgi:hypothetical protein
MSEPLDAYTDQFSITLSPYGVNLSFLVTPPHQDPAKPIASTPVATIRMSVEHAKVMVMVIKRHIQRTEEQTGVQARVSPQILNQLGISPEDWDSFWKINR